MPSYTLPQFAARVLKGLGAPATPENVRAIVGWAKAEGGDFNNDSRFNPLNTTQPAPGATNTGTQGNIKQYRSLEQGVGATVTTLKNGRYGPILQAFSQGNSAGAVADAIGRTPWGTDGAFVRRVIGATGPQGVPSVGATTTPARSAGTPGTPAVPDVTTSRVVPDVMARKQALAAYLLNRGKPGALTTALAASRDATRTITTTKPGTPGVPAVPSTRPASGPSRDTGGKLRIEELFYDGGINLDGGRRVGAIGGHGTHNHVSFGSEQSRAEGVALAKKLGLTVTSEGGGKHTAGSFHYRKFANGKSQGVDFGGPPAALKKFNREIARRAK